MSDDNGSTTEESFDIGDFLKSALQLGKYRSVVEGTDDPVLQAKVVELEAKVSAGRATLEKLSHT